MALTSSADAHRPAAFPVQMVVLALLLAGLAGCRTETPASPVPTRPLPTDAPSPVVVPTAVISPTSDIITLTWWTPEFFSPLAPQPARPLLAEDVAQFEATFNGKVRISPVLKAKYGKGGLLDYLRTAQPVAPSLLPDVVTLDVTELDQAATLGLLQPLDTLLPAELLSQLYPFAYQAGHFQDQLLAVQITADFDHAIYNRSQVKIPPDTWSGLLSQRVSYLFPAGSPQPLSVTSPPEGIQPIFLGQYLSAGGKLDPKTRELIVEEQPLLRVLSFYSDARQTGLLPANISQVTGLDDTWTGYTQGQVAMVDISARRYLAARETLQNTGFAADPGWSTPAVPVTSGWALAIITADPARQQAAAKFIVWLLAPARAGAWSQAAGWLPTTKQALATWGQNAYYTFLNEQLAAAVSQPIGSDYAPTAVRLEKAVITVLQGSSNPADASQAVLNPPK